MRERGKGSGRKERMSGKEKEREPVAVGKKECRKKKVFGRERVNGPEWDSVAKVFQLRPLPWG